MRIWKVDASELSDEHLGGEHREIHSLAGIFTKQIDTDQRKAGGWETGRYQGFRPFLRWRHDRLVTEYRHRLKPSGSSHLSPFPEGTFRGQPIELDLKPAAEIDARILEGRYIYWHSQKKSWFEAPDPKWTAEEIQRDREDLIWRWNGGSYDKDSRILGRPPSWSQRMPPDWYLEECTRPRCGDCMHQSWCQERYGDWLKADRPFCAKFKARESVKAQITCGHCRWIDFCGMHHQVTADMKPCDDLELVRRPGGK